PDSARAHLAMAVVQWFRNDRRGFDQHADMALALNANDPAVAGELGLRFVLRGEWERGRPLIDRVVSRDPQGWQIYRTAYAMHAVETGDYATALDELDRTKVSDRPIMRVMRAAIYGQLGYSDRAAEEWHAAAEDVPRIIDEPRAWLSARGASG